MSDYDHHELFYGSRPTRAEWVADYWQGRPARFEKLQRMTAEMMAIPQLRCRRRVCRRRHSCRFVGRDDRRPSCLQNLRAGEREGYEALLEKAKYRHAELMTRGYIARSDLDFAALEVDLAVTPPGDERIADLRAFWRRFPAKP